MQIQKIDLKRMDNGHLSSICIHAYIHTVFTLQYTCYTYLYTHVLPLSEGCWFLLRFRFNQSRTSAKEQVGIFYYQNNFHSQLSHSTSPFNLKQMQVSQLIFCFNKRQMACSPSRFLTSCFYPSIFIYLYLYLTNEIKYFHFCPFILF